MGESKTVSIARLSAAVTAGLAATALLASCSAVHTGAGTSATPDAAPSSQPVATATASADPSVSETATPAPTETLETVTPTAAAAAAESRSAVVPFVTSATWSAKSGLDVSAIVPKIVEKGGTCTAVAVKGDTAVKASGPAVAASSYTGCQQLAIKPADLAPGTWQVRVSYSSDESAGTSAARTVTVG